MDARAALTARDRAPVLAPPSQVAATITGKKNIRGVLLLTGRSRRWRPSARTGRPTASARRVARGRRGGAGRRIGTVASMLSSAAPDGGGHRGAWAVPAWLDEPGEEPTDGGGNAALRDPDP